MSINKASSQNYELRFKMDLNGAKQNKMNTFIPFFFIFKKIQITHTVHVHVYERRTSSTSRRFNLLTSFTAKP